MDAAYEVRQYVLRSKLDELPGDRLPFPFFAMRPCPCTKSEMTSMMTTNFSAISSTFKLDGLLFYYRAVSEIYKMGIVFYTHLCLGKLHPCRESSGWLAQALDVARCARR